jgi:hypothetical protein
MGRKRSKEKKKKQVIYIFERNTGKVNCKWW